MVLHTDCSAVGDPSCPGRWLLTNVPNGSIRIVLPAGGDVVDLSEVLPDAALEELPVTAGCLSGLEALALVGGEVLGMLIELFGL